MAQDLKTAGLIHDLRNVFETIGEAAELLSTDERWATLAAAIQRSLKQGRRVAASVLEATETIEFELILDNAVQSTRDFLVASRHSTILFACRFPAGIRIEGKPGEWERVFVNLFLNAARAMPDGGEIEVSAQFEDNFLVITVSDTGRGIPDDILKKMFTPGFSTEHSRSGLGLSIVDSIVQSHGGTVEAENRAEGGARFRIRVPRSGGQRPDADAVVNA